MSTSMLFANAKRADQPLSGQNSDIWKMWQIRVRINQVAETRPAERTHQPVAAP